MKKSLLFLFYFLLCSSLWAQNYFISGSNTHSVMLCNNGKVFAWGGNEAGQIGVDNSNTPYNSQYYPNPQPVGGIPEIVQVDAGSGAHTLAVTCDGRVVAWGSNNFGQLGNSTIAPIQSAPTYVAGVSGEGQLSNVINVSGGNDESFAVLASGEVVAWGQNDKGQLGIGTSSEPIPYPQNVMIDEETKLTNAIMVEAGDETNFALADPENDGLYTVYSWGGIASSSGLELGRGTTDNMFAKPVEKENGEELDRIISISAGDRHTLAIDQDGYVWAWGGDFGMGQVGDGYNNGGYYFQNFATKVVAGELASSPELWKTEYLGGPDNPVVSIAAGQAHSVAALADGTVVTWGSNGFFNCGDGCATPSGQLAAGTDRFLTYESFALNADGANTAPIIALRTDGSPLENVVKVSEGDAWTFAMTAEGKIFVSGFNENGELGIGSTENQFAFTEFIVPDCGTASECPNPDLGNDLEVCLPFSVELSAGQVHPGFKVSWYYNNNLVESEQITQEAKEVIFTASRTGEWTVKIEDNRPQDVRPCEPCTDVSSSVIIKEIPAPFEAVESTFCETPTFGDFGVTPAGEYNWFSSRNGGEKLNNTPTTTFSTELSNTEEIITDSIYALYAEDVSVYNTSVANARPCSNASNTINGNEAPMMFTAYDDFTIKSVDIVQKSFLSDGSSDYFVELLDNKPGSILGTNGNHTDGPGEVLATSVATTLPNSMTPAVKTLTVNLPVSGSSNGKKYWLRIKEGNQIVHLDCDGSFPYADNSENPNIEIEKSILYNLSTPAFGSMFNWQISSGSDYPCQRLQVLFSKASKLECVISGTSTSTKTKNIAYPNPFTDRIEVMNIDAEEVRLLNSQGVTVAKSSNGKLILKDNIKPGVYLIQIKTKDTIKTQKVVKISK